MSMTLDIHPKELEDAVRAVKRSATTTSTRASDGTLLASHRYSSTAVTALLELLSSSAPGLKDNLQRLSPEEVNMVKARLRYLRSDAGPRRYRHPQEVELAIYRLERLLQDRAPLKVTK